MGTKVLSEQVTQSKHGKEEVYCSICTQNGRICPHTWDKFTTHLDLEESDKESYWDADIENTGNYARAPIRRPKLPSKEVVFQPRRCPVGWPHGVRPMAPPTRDQVPSSYYYPSSLSNELEKEQKPQSKQDSKSEKVWDQMLVLENDEPGIPRQSSCQNH